MSYGKIDNGTGLGHTDVGALMTCPIQPDNTWLPISGFARDGSGNLYTYYTNPTTPDMVKNVKINNAEKISLILDILDDTTVTFAAHQYSISREKQYLYAEILSVLEHLPHNSEKSVFDINNERVLLKKNDIEEILLLASEAEETIITNNW